MPPVFFFNIIFVVTKTESKETVLLEILIFQCIPMGSFTKRNHCSNLKFWIWMKYGVADFSWRGPCHQKLQIFGFGLYFQGFQVVAHKSKFYGPAATWGPWRRESRSFAHRESKSLETKPTAKYWVLGNMDPSNQNRVNHTSLLSKIWDLNDNFLWIIPIQALFLTTCRILDLVQKPRRMTWHNLRFLDQFCSFRQ